MSKGFGLIDRFSEDIDVRIDAGRVEGLIEPTLSWQNRKRGPDEREAWFDALGNALEVPSCTISRDATVTDKLVRSAGYHVQYPHLHAAGLPATMRPFVLLEVGRARVVPFVVRPLSSWVHDHVGPAGLADFVDNRPAVIRCIHPWVTCLEKLEAIAKKCDQGRAAADFVRHYEDAARILAAQDTLPELEGGVPMLIEDLAREDKTIMPSADHPAFVVGDDDRWSEINQAWVDIAPMFWAPRQPLTDAAQVIRTFLEQLA